jgi:hypothetical protein
MENGAIRTGLVDQSVPDCPGDPLLPFMQAARLFGVKQKAVLLRPLTGGSLLQPANSLADKKCNDRIP